MCGAFDQALQWYGAALQNPRNGMQSSVPRFSANMGWNYSMIGDYSAEPCTSKP
jgi:hypothetical protein